MATVQENMKAQRERRNKEIIDTVKEVCKKFDGLADIGGGYSVVDTSKFNVVLK